MTAGRAAKVERFLTTVLMTDIVGSTEHAAELGDTDWRELVGQHHRIVRGALRRRRGREIDTAGDGFFAIFDAPADAIACALEIVREVQALGIEIRAGIHTGEVEQSGPKVAGITVPIASRIMSLAEPSQVLVSSTVRDLVAGASLTFDDAGRHTLKGVPGEWQVFAVSRAAGHASDGVATAADATDLRAAAIRRARSRPIWVRRPRLVVGIALGLVAVLIVTTLLVWQPWLPPALAQVGSDSVGVIDEARDVIIGSIPVDSQPGGVAIADGVAWVTNTGANTVSEIDVRSRTVTRVIDVGTAPAGIAVAGGSVWVANSGARTVTRINQASGRVVGTVTVGNGPLAIAAAGNSVWVANVSDSSLVQINASTAAAGAGIPVASGPVSLAADETGLWVASADAAVVTHLDANTAVTLAAPISLPSRPTAIASGSGAVWVAGADGTITRIDEQTNRLTTTIDVGGSLSAVAVSGNELWLADRGGSVLRLDAANPAATPRRISTTSAGQALTAGDGQMWIAARAASTTHRGGTLHVITFTLPLLDAFDLAGPVWLEADGLVAYRHVGGAAGATLVPDLAAALPKPTNGGRTYAFQLRPGLIYSTGEPVHASDFRRAIERSFMVPGFNGFAAGNDVFKGLVGIDACAREDGKPVPNCDLSAAIVADDSANSVTFNLSQPTPDFVFTLATQLSYPVPANTPMSTMIDGAFPGTGPYTVTEHDDKHFVVGRNPNFKLYDADARPDGYPDQIEWSVAASPDDAVAAVERGDADYLRLQLQNRLPGATFRQISGAYPAQLHFASNAVASVTMNTAMAPFNNVQARQAVNMAIDRGHVVDLRGGPESASVTCQVLPIGWAGYEPYCPYTTNPDPGGRWQAPDLDAARRLIDQSGTRGAKVVVGPALGLFTEERDYLATVLQNLGYDVSVDTKTDADYVFPSHFDENRVQISVWEWFSASLAPSEFLHSFVCGGDGNVGTTNFCDSDYDALVASADELQQTDPAAAISKWTEADRKITDFAPWASLYNEGSDFVSSRVGNYQFHLFYLGLLDQMWVQ